MEHGSHADVSRSVIEAAVIVGRDSQKAIVIGKGGAKIKELGIMARTKLEEVSLLCCFFSSLFLSCVHNFPCLDVDRFPFLLFTELNYGTYLVSSAICVCSVLGKACIFAAAG
jgi:hypothetical protein